VTALSADEVATFRSALAKMMSISDDRGYQYWAGIHGLPLPISCTHGTPLFLPWHRAYLYYFEQYLMDQEPGVTLPWWDWSTQQGVPPIYADTSAPNPLSGSPITGIPDSQFAGQQISPVTDTYRVPGRPGALPNAAHVQWLINLETFADFTQQVEQTHNNVHSWVGGTMDEIPVAAFDPIFWAHHTMIDRIWALWQQKHPGAGTGGLVPTEQPLGPFPTLNVGQTFDIATLGYEYAASTSTGRP
jgi:tyrosinase